MGRVDSNTRLKQLIAVTIVVVLVAIDLLLGELVPSLLAMLVSSVSHGAGLEAVDRTLEFSLLLIASFLGTVLLIGGFLNLTDRRRSYLDLHIPTAADGLYIISGLIALLLMDFGISVLAFAFELPRTGHSIATLPPRLILLYIPFALLVVGPVEELFYRLSECPLCARSRSSVLRSEYRRLVGLIERCIRCRTRFWISLPSDGKHSRLHSCPWIVRHIRCNCPLCPTLLRRDSGVAHY